MDIKQFTLVTENDFPIQSINDWEKEVKKNLKLDINSDSDTIYKILTKNNSLGIKSKGYYTQLDTENLSLIKIKKTEEFEESEDCFHFYLGLNQDLNYIDSELDLDIIHHHQFAIDISAHNTKELTNNSIIENATLLSLLIEVLEKISSHNPNLINQIEYISLNKGINSDFLSEISALRSLRICYDYIFNEFIEKHKNDQTNLKIPKLVVKSRSVYNNKSSLDLYNNIIRLTIETMAAILGNADYIENISYDFNLGGQVDAELLFENVINVIIDESKVNIDIDNLYGAFYIEKLTNDISIETLNLINQFNTPNFDDYIVSESFSNYIKSQNQKVIKSINTAEVPLIGINKIFNSLGDNFEFVENLINTTDDRFYYKRFAQEFEKIRLENKKFTETYSESLTSPIYIACIGEKINYLPRLDYVKDFMGVLGYNLGESYQISSEFEVLEDVVDTCSILSPAIIGFCATNDTYNALLRDFANTIKKILPMSKIVVFGHPKTLNNYENLLKSYDNIEFVYKGVDLIEINHKISSHLVNYYEKN